MTDKQDDRLRKPEPAQRQSHAASDLAVTQDVELNDEARLELLRGLYAQAILPDIPPIPGYHVVWLASNNSRDSITQRMRLGYTPVRPEEVPQFNFHETSIQRGSAFGDVITINEMMAFKLPQSLYQMYMMELHHNQPNSQEEMLKARNEQMAEQAKGHKARLEIEEGMQALRHRVPNPTF